MSFRSTPRATMTIYVGKGKYVKGDAKKFAGRDNLLTGGWAGGEVGLKVGEKLTLKKGDLVKVAAGGGFFGVGGKPAARRHRSQGERQEERRLHD